MGLLRYLLIVGAAYLGARWLRRAFSAPPPSSPPASSPPDARSAWAVLGVAPGAGPQEIRAAWQARLQEYHPDKVAHMAPEIRALAELRTKEINAAYQVLRG